MRKIQILTITVLGSILFVGCQGTASMNDFFGFNGPEREPNPKQNTQQESGSSGQNWGYQPRQQHTFTDVGDDRDPYPTRNGKWLYFVSNRNNENYDLYRTRLDRKAGVQRLTSTPVDERLPVVHPKNPNIIALARNGDRGWNIWLYRRGAEQTWKQITTSNGPEAWPSWSPSGNKLAYARYHTQEGQWHTWVYDAKKDVQQDMGPGYWPVWHPSKENTLCVVNARRRDPRLFFLERIVMGQSGRFQMLQDSKEAAVSPSWAPDGSSLVYTKVTGNSAADRSSAFSSPDQSSLWLLDTTDLQSSQLTSTRGKEWFPRWGKNGRIYFLASNEGHANIYSISAPELKKEEGENKGESTVERSEEEDKSNGSAVKQY